MDTTTISGSTCSKGAARPLSNRTWPGSKASRSAGSTSRPWTPMASRSICRRLDLPDLVLAPGIQSVVQRCLERDLAVIIFPVHHREAVSDRFQTGSLRGDRDIG